MRLGGQGFEAALGGHESNPEVVIPARQWRRAVLDPRDLLHEPADEVRELVDLDPVEATANGETLLVEAHRLRDRRGLQTSSLPLLLPEEVRCGQATRRAIVAQLRDQRKNLVEVEDERTDSQVDRGLRRRVPTAVEFAQISGRKAH